MDKDITKKYINEFISIIIPVYKDPEGIKDTLDSLVKQDFDKNNYEIIIGNDDGDKETENICKMYNTKVINIIPNKGSYNARNEAIKESKGEYLAFIDADIKASKDWLSNGVKLLKKYDYLGGAVDIDKSSLRNLSHYYEYLTAFNNENKFNKFHYSPTANLFIKRNVLSRLGLFDSKLRSGGDVEFGNRVYISKLFKMAHSNNIRTIHPPRGKKKLINKNIRTLKGTFDLAELYPRRFNNYKFSFTRYFKTLLLPIYKVLTSKREIGFSTKIKLVLWSIHFGTVNLVNLIKLRHSRII